MRILSRSAFGLLLLLTVTAWAADRGSRTEYVEVDVTGSAPFPQEVSAERARRAALADARRNALLRAHVLVEREAEVENLQLHSEQIRERSAAYIQRLEVIEAGPVAGNGRRLYQVRARAILRPLSIFSAAEGLVLSRPDPWQPVVALTVQTDGDRQLAERTRGVLDGTLHGCGVRVAEAGARDPALELTVAAREESTEHGQAVTVEWEAGFGMEADEDWPGRPALLRGTWRASGREEPEEAWWQSLGAVIAQDVYRLWATPRWTTVRFENADEELADHLARLMNRPGGARVRIEEEGVVVAGFPLTGNPLSAVRAMLEHEGLSGRAELRNATLTELTFHCGASAAE
ncbi:MAG: hypothetical protein R6X33_12730 [Candidatus Brocadiia bacterium]